MISFDEARSMVLSGVARLPGELAALQEAIGRVRAEPLIARDPFPAFSASAMDGYAVRAGDFAGSGPFTFDVVGESRSGALPAPLARGAVCRIFTGAALPEGADTVVMQEDVL